MFGVVMVAHATPRALPYRPPADPSELKERVRCRDGSRAWGSRGGMCSAEKVSM
jgi:hypothetical protein